MSVYQVDPALEYRTFAHPSSQKLDYARPSIRHDGRVLAVGTNRGVILWDLACGTELRFLPIGLAWHIMFEPNGDLLTNGTFGFQRWPVRLDEKHHELVVGPPRTVGLPASDSAIAEDRSGCIVAVADHNYAFVAASNRRFQVGPLADCRYISVSPDGHWLATGSHAAGGVQIWQIGDRAEAVKLPTDEGTLVCFSPDGRWLMTQNPPCRLWPVGNWQDPRQIGGSGQCFSPDGRLLVVQDESRVLRLVETESGRTLAKLESPDLCVVRFATFSPDGTRLVVTTNDGPAAHIWDLRAIRRNLAEMGLDWHAPPLPDPEISTAGAGSSSALKVKIDFGPLASAVEQHNNHLAQIAVPAEEAVARSTERLRADPQDLVALHERGHALLRLSKFKDALADFSAASAKEPGNVHLRVCQGFCLFKLKEYTLALDQLEPALQTNLDSVRAISELGREANNAAWTIAKGREPGGDAILAVRLAAFSVALSPEDAMSFNTLGVALYRAGRFAEAVEALEKSQRIGKGQLAAFDLFFLAMAHHQLRHAQQARECLKQANDWLESNRKTLSPDHIPELTNFRAEAEVALSGQPDERPANVFATER